MPPSSSQSGNRSLERQAMWLSALKANRLPAFVTQRLNDARDGKTPWISTMTAPELLIAKTHGIRPVAMVSATCALHYGFSWTRGHAEGWRTALTRLKEEAVAAGANAVVDVKLRTTSIGVESSMDYTLVGTAVKVAGMNPSPDPVVATVPALEFVRLLEAGIVPVGIAIGAAYDWLTGYNYAYQNFGSYNFGTANLDGSFSSMNRPLTQLGDFWEMIRRRAIADLTSDTRSQGNGVLAHTHFGQLIKSEGGDNQPPRYLGRHIVLGTVVETGNSHYVPHAIRTVVDMRDELSPLNGGTSSRNHYPVETEGGEI